MQALAAELSREIAVDEIEKETSPRVVPAGTRALDCVPTQLLGIGSQ